MAKSAMESNLGGGGTAVAKRAERVRRGFWPKIRRSMGRIPFAEEALTAYYCAFDPKTPTRVRGILLAALAYFIMPVDLIPDFIAGLGFTDDASVLFAAWSAVASHIDDRHRARAASYLAGLADQPGSGG